MKKPEPVAVYWDSTSILSALIKDPHSEQAITISKKEGIHFLAALCYVEVCSALSEIRKNKKLKEVQIDVALEILKTGPWRRLNIWPDWNILIALSEKWPLKGSRLWHLASVKSLKKQLPELSLFTFDGELRRAAEGEGLLLS